MARRLFLVLLLVFTGTGCARKSRLRERAERQAAADKNRVSSITDVGLKVIFFDLGQADAMLVLYQGKTLLFDAGESREAEDSNRYHVIAQTLQELTGKKHLDYFVLSHYHRDHVGKSTEGTGLWGVLDDGVTIDTVHDRGDVVFSDNAKTDVHEDWLRAMPGWLSSGKVKSHIALKLGDKIDLGPGLDVTVVAVNGNGMFEKLMADKPEDLSIWPASENDFSVALKLTYGDFELFTGGDLTGATVHKDYKGNKEGYHDVESSIAGKVGDVEIYRVNHHGSQYSSNGCFIKTLRPEVSIVSSGANNYGHPHGKVYDPLMDIGRVYITGGADDKVKDHVLRSIVGDDIVVTVEANGGKRFSVNNRDYKSKTDAEEEALPGRVAGCETAPW
ncbi:MAG: hypothetical protein JNK82_38995 [Myxococcaceae bacterium]|nr:hypothetical protein [Myxococcaceae bacterium]